MGAECVPMPVDYVITSYDVSCYCHSFADAADGIFVILLGIAAVSASRGVLYALKGTS
jgi:hypothetical protein